MNEPVVEIKVLLETNIHWDPEIPEKNYLNSKRDADDVDDDVDIRDVMDANIDKQA